MESVIWPKRVVCLLCEELSHGEYLCEDCAKELRFLRYRNNEHNRRCAYRYEYEARDLVLELKFNQMADAALVLAGAMAEEAQSMNLPPDTVITWVSMPKRRFYERGIDHGRLLAQAVAERIGLPAKQLLIRTKRTAEQHKLSKEQRQTNLRNAFAYTQELNGPVLLVDDVLTTGATTATCAEVLRAAGATQVYILAAAKVKER